jgi:hypothetical protein
MENKNFYGCTGRVIKENTKHNPRENTSFII